MFAFRYERIFGKVWVSDKGAVYADSVADARPKILAKFSIPDPHEHHWIEQDSKTGVRFVLDVSSEERVAFWQEPSLFDSENEAGV